MTTPTTTTPDRRRHRKFQAGAAAMTLGVAILFSGVASAGASVAPTLLMGPACVSGESVMHFEITNPGATAESLVITIGGETVLDGIEMAPGDRVTGSVPWPEGVPTGDDVPTVASWSGTSHSTMLVSRGDMCSNPQPELPSRGPELLAGLICEDGAATISFRLTNNDEMPHEMNVAVSEGTTRDTPETVIWPSVGGTLSVAPGETISKDGVSLPEGFPAGSSMRIRGWWRTGESTTHNRVIGIVPDCYGPEPTTTTTVPETTTTVAETTTTTVPETTTTVAETTTTTVPETTTTVAETTTTAQGQTTTTAQESTTTAAQASSTTNSVGGVTQTSSSPTNLAVTGGDASGRTLAGGLLLLAGAALMWFGRPARSRTS